MASWQETYKKLKKQKEVVDMLSGGGDLAPIKSSVSNRNLYTNGAESKLQSNIAPTKTTTKSTKSSSSGEKKKDTWFSKGAFDDGYDFGDITKTILGTTGDVVTGVAKGVFGLGEGIGDTINYGVAGVADLVGQDEWADKYRKEVSKSLTDQIFKPAEDFYDKYSVLGEKSDNITQGLGNVAAIIGTGGLGASAGLGAVGTSALTSGTIGVSSMGSGMSEAYQGGATDEEALKYGLISGVAEAGTEMIFGGLGKGVNALGLSKGLSSADDMLAKAVSNKFKTQLAKNLSEYTVKVGAEGLEEVMSGLVQGIGKKVTYMSEEELGKILADEQLLDQFIMGAVTSGVAQAHGLVKTTKAGRDYVSGYTQNEQSVIDKEVENRIGDKKLTNKEISKITDEVKEQLSKGYISTDTIESVLGGDTYTQLQSIRDNKTAIEQEIDQLENKPITEMTVKENERLKALREELASIDTNTLENQLQSEMGQKIANDGYLQQSYQEKANRGQQFTYDTTKITNENEKAVYESATKFMNNTNRSHEFVEKVAKIAKDKGTNYGFTNNEELKSLGHNVDGKQVNGLVRTTQDGKQTVLINVDSAKALNTIVGHETTHLLEGTTEYQDLQEAIFNYAKTKGDFDTRQASLNELYEGIEGADVNSELTADLVGDYLFTDTDFINSLSTQKPTVFQKIKDLIDDLVIRFKGTKEEKQLREVQKRFKEAYRKNATDTNVATKDTTQIDFTEAEQHAINKWSGINSYFINEALRNGQQPPTNYSGLNLDAISKDLSTALKKLPSYEGTVYRSIPLEGEALTDFLNRYQEGNVVTENAYTSASVGEIYDDGWNIQMEIQSHTAKDTTELFRKEEHEVLFDKGTKFKVLEVDASDLKNIKLKVEDVTDVKTNTQYSLTDNQGRTLTKEQQEYFKDSKVRDENGNLKVLYHGTATGEFTVFDKSKANPESDWGAGFYLTDSEYDVENNYEDGGADFDNKIARLAEQIEQEQDISYEDAEIEAQQQLYKGSYKITSYVNIENPAIVGQTYILDGETTYDVKDLDDYDGDLEGYYQDLIYDITEDIQYNVEVDGDIESLSNVLWESVYDGGIEIQQLKDKINELYLTDYDGNMIGNEVAREILEYLGYDGIIDPTVSTKWNMDMDSGTTHYIAFKPNQIKNITNENPTDNPDINMSLSNKGEQIAPTGNYNVYGEDVKLEIAPLQEEIKTLTETVQELKEQIAPIAENNAEVEYTQPTKAELDNLMALQKTGGTEYANTFFELRDKYGQPKLYKGINEYKKAPDTYEAPIKGDEFAPITEADLPMLEQQYEEDFRNIDESSMPIETKEFAPVDEVTPTKSLFETRNYEDVGSRKINAYQYDNPEVKPFFQEEAQAMLGDLKSSIKGERSYNDQLYYESGGEQGYFGTERQTTSDIAELLDGMDGKYKYTYADIEKGLNAIINDEGSENNAVSKRIEFYLDQRLREGYTTVDGIEVPANQQYIELLEAKDITDYYNSIPVTDDLAPVENVKKPVENVSNSNIAEKIAPVKEEYLAITPEKEPKLIKVKDNPTYNQIAEVLVEEPKTENQRNKRKWAIFKANVLDKGIVFEDLSLKENNRELIAKWDYTLTSESRGQYAIGNGHNGLSKSLNDIRAEVDNTGNTKDFYNYMYHKHNIDRMTLATRFEGMENKPVFGDNVTAEQSQAIVNQYEKTHPEFLEFAQDVYDYVNADKQLLIDNGVISQETADLWSQMYPHYVPTRRTTDTGIDINVPLDTRKTGINAPIKKATGGSSNILPLFDTMAMRTLQTYRATAKNSFGVELKNTIGTTVESNQTNVDEVIDSIDAQDGLLQEGKKGSSPTFTVFENGEKITFEITKDMYDALRPLDESSMLSKTYKLPNVISNVRRGLLTEYNPTFLLTNAIKDTQDILLNSQHASRTYSKIPEAHKQLLSKGYWYQEYVANGGEQNSYFDSETNTFKTENKGLDKITNLPPLKAISNLNNHIEMIPRLAEYIASREAGRSIEVSMLDAARVTTNFKAGGAVTKWANRNGATFLNASVQGAMQQVRNIREAKANGVKGWVNLATKFAIAGLPAILLNNLIWDDDEEYDDLSDYVKQNYYVIGKTDDGTFIRIPKGRTVAVIQEGINQMSNLITGDDEADLKSFIDLMINNLAPNNPLDNNVISPIIQVANNEAWYGGDLVPTRLQKMPDAEQYDESTDMLSRWLGEIFDYSPYKINYLIDQYSGGLGDVLLPMMTPEAESDGDSITDYLFAPLKSKFTTNSTFNNQNVSDFYDTKEKLTVQANKSNATDEDVLKNKYMNSINSELSELYTQKREIQNSDLPNSEKYKQAKEIQEQINALTKNALSEYTNVSEYSNFATIGDREYYKRINSDGEVEWTKVDGDETDDLNSLGMTEKEKNTYFATKSEISKITKDTEDADAKKLEIIDSILSSGMSDEQKAYLYGKHYSSDETLDKVTDSGISFDDYLTFNKDTLSIESAEQKVEHLYNSDFTDEAKTVIYETSVLSGFDNEDKYKDYKVSKAAGIDINSWLSYKKQEFVADKDSAGNSISGSRKEKIISYINSLDLSIPQKAMLIRQEYSTYRDYNNQIVEYVGGLDISYEDKVFILEGLDMTVDDDGNVYWD